MTDYQKLDRLIDQIKQYLIGAKVSLVYEMEFTKNKFYLRALLDIDRALDCISGESIEEILDSFEKHT